MSTPRYWVLSNDGLPMLVSAFTPEGLAQFQRERKYLKAAAKAMRCEELRLVETIERAQRQIDGKMLR